MRAVIVTVFIALMPVVFLATPAYSEPFVWSDPNPDLLPGAVFRIEVDGAVVTVIEDGEPRDLFPVEDQSVYWDAQDLPGGQRVIRAQFGNPWPVEDGVSWRWTEWTTDPLRLSVPKRTGAPTLHLVQKK